MSQSEVALEAPGLNLREYMGVIKTRKWSLLIVTILVCGIALFLSFRQTPLYRSQAKVLVKAVPLRSGSFSSIPNLETERELVQSQPVTSRVDEKMGGPNTTGHLEVTLAPETEVLNIDFVDPDPVEAKQRSESYADAYLAFRRKQVVNDLLASSQSVQDQVQSLNVQLDKLNDKIKKTNNPSKTLTLQAQINSATGQIAILQQQLTQLTPPERLEVGQVVEHSEVPTSPFSPNHVLNGLLGLFAGLGLGIATVFLRERLDDRLKGKADLEERVEAPVLAVVPQLPHWRRGKQTMLISLDQPKSAASEAYRTLRTGVLFAAGQRSIKTILVTSAQAGEGKTATTANLGVVLAQANKRVIIVSADLRKPRISRFFGLHNRPGLTEVFRGQAALRDALHNPKIKNLRVLASGAIPANPAELLGSDMMKNVLEELRGAADFILIDGPPVLALADAITLAPLADGVLFIADAENTSRSAVSHARAQLDQVNARVIGTVLNNFNPSRAGAYQYHYRYYYAGTYGTYAEQSEKTSRLGRRRSASQDNGSDSAREASGASRD
jgi:capsular exopolysaccharide synthesis family protein